MVRVLTKVLGREENRPSTGHIRAPEPPDDTHRASRQTARGRNGTKDDEKQWRETA
jgi:hypothetical protein